MYFRTIITVATCAVGLAAGAAHSQVTLSAASAFPEGHLFSVQFERMIKEFNETHGDEIVIDYKGGAPAIGSPFTLGERLQAGQFDMLNNTGPYYETVVPVALALILTEVPMEELRETDWMAAMQEAHQARGLHYLGKTIQNAPFHLYLRESIEAADLTGLRLRVAPHYQPFFSSLGATTMRANLAEVYTMIENGSIDGFGWPIIGFLPDWLNITKYRVDPGFYDTDLNVVMNLESWNGLSDAHKSLVDEMVQKYEADSAKIVGGWVEEARATMEEAGIETLTFDPDEEAKWSKAAVETAWETVMSRDPEIGARLRAAAGGE
ncbi:TRAP transporter substrate-binding protein DctP [Seohaeicola saemankumensis]|uniref:TRAP transporter substrate-binding protein DctP n=1 Tax=Seohaeicola TaxID=481178 RepID=UPI0035D00C7A